ncbi:Ribonuclease P [Bertholletia excelsa]
MAVDRSKQSRVSATVPPRSLNVQKFAESRAAELETLHSIVASRLSDDFRSQRNKRRRTTGYDNRVGKKRYRKGQKSAMINSGNLVTSERGQGKAPRHIRRRIELRKNPVSGYSTSGDGTKRLRTHVWHAKRFRMTKLWGFHLPLGLQGRGRGSRALLKRFKDGVLMHDASSYGAVQLEGQQDLLQQVLSRVLVPFQSPQSEDSFHSILSGATYGKAMLHDVGAPFSPAIAPVIYVWRPILPQNMVDTGHHMTDGYKAQQNFDGCSFRQLWVWIHASAFSEGYDSLKLSCQKQMDETGGSINYVSLLGKLAKLEIMGSKAFNLLCKTLYPVTSFLENSEQVDGSSVRESDMETSVKKFSILENDCHIPPSGVISLVVSDPRDLSNNKNELIPGANSFINLGNMREDEGKNFSASEGIQGKDMESSSLVEFKKEKYLPENTDLWDFSKGILPPLEENLLCMEKHHRRLASFCIGNRNSRMQNASAGGPFCRSCPIVLLNESNQKYSIARWSIILPLSWVKAFWDPLVCGGAHAIGLREKHWIAGEVGLPYFPSDFPDCYAYSCYMQTEAAFFDKKAKCRPPAIRPVRAPIPPPWQSVRVALNSESVWMKDAQTHSEEPCSVILNNEVLTRSECDQLDALTDCPSGFSFQGFVARTSNMLMQFLSDINGNHLLLCPYVYDSKCDIAKLMNDDSRISEGPSSTAALTTDYGQRLCYLRVILRAYKGGVFEEGAVVCAPYYSDITLWTSRPDNEEKLQIPQSSASSYSELQPSGKWEGQSPLDPAAKASHRWPMGFVTSGFVRGSKKPSAVALCEAVMLSCLREEQRNKMPVKQSMKEIYVLVRNMKSTAYRLALASIVLEHQEEDLLFM